MCSSVFARGPDVQERTEALDWMLFCYCKTLYVDRIMTQLEKQVYLLQYIIIIVTTFVYNYNLNYYNTIAL